MKIAIDVSPLRESRDYRLLWTGQLVSLCGTQLRFVAVTYQVFLLTHSPVKVGLLGAFQAGPLIAFSLFGGVVADAVNRRRLLLITQAGLAGTSFVLALVTQLGSAHLWFIYVITAVAASFSAMDGPARSSLAPTLVRREQIPSAMALNQAMFQTSSIVGPALGGLVIARVGVAAAYWVDVATFGASLLAVSMMRPTAAAPGGAKAGLGSLFEGLRYLVHNRILLSTMSLDFVAMFFGWPRALFPFFATQIFHRGPTSLGLLFAAPAAGALAGALATGWVSAVKRQGAAVIWCVVGWGLAITAFGAIRGPFFLALVLLAAAGAADVFSAVFRGTIVQMATPDHLRGRMNSVNLMFVIGGPRLGEVESGIVASLFSPQVSVVSGGVACLVGAALVAALVPRLRSYVTDQDT